MKKLFLLPLQVVFLLLCCIPAYAVTFNEVIDMTEAGVSSDVIVSLLEATESVFRLSADDIVALETAGVDDDIILAMISGPDEKDDIQSDERFITLTDEQFRRLYLERDMEVSPEPSYTPEREPQYYRSSGSSFGQGYISTPNYSTSGYSSGQTRTTYFYNYPGTYSYNRKYYRPVYNYYPYSYGYNYRHNPGYYIYDGVVYYPGTYYNNHYPRYYEAYKSGYKYHYRPYSRVGVREYPNDDWHFSLGFSF